MSIKSLYVKVSHNQIIERAFHAAWQAGFGYVIATMAGTHGDIRGVVTAGAAVVLSAAKTSLMQSLSHDVPAAAAPVVAGAPVLPVTVVETPSTPASAPPAAQ